MKISSHILPSLLIILLGLAGALTGCSTQSVPTPAAVQPQPTKTVDATPQAGQANLKGRLISQIDNKPLPNVAVRLAQIYRQNDQAAFMLDLARSPGNFTDKDGYFFIVDVLPAEYYVIIGEPSDNHYVIATDDKQKSILLTTEKDKVLDAGTIKTDYVP